MADLAHILFGTAQPDAIAGFVDAFCTERLGSPVERFEFHATSVASVHGIRLADGRRVVVKVHRAHVDRAHLAAVQEVQARLTAAGFPAPEPLLAPMELCAGVAIAESLLDEGEWADAHDPVVRRAVAGGLARLVAVGRPLVDIPGLGRLPDATERLWALPHDPRFDFEGTAHGAEWIDRLRDAASRELERWAAGEVVVGHADWRVEHLRFAAGRLTAVYDWDSLTVAREPEIAGAAAHAFTTDWSIEDFAGIPAPEESLAFLDDYEQARGVPFTGAERRTAELAMIRSLAYGARCEHSDVLTDFGTRPASRGLAPPTPGGYREMLAVHAERVLAAESA